jgi:hypothetical protein
MKKYTGFLRAGILMLFFVIPGMMMAQADKKAVDLKRLETGLTTAKNNVAKNERMLTVADSLIAKGTEQTNESKAENKAIATERKVLDKEYASQKKALEKLTTSKDKAEATQAKTDMKALDLKYKADAKALDIRLKDATKKSTTGTANISKGKTSKKTATDGLKTAQAALDAAQEKYNAAAGIEPPEEEGKGKKKDK